MIKLLFLLMVLPLAAFDPVDMSEITFINRLASGCSIEFVFVAPSGGNAWGPDLLKKASAPGIKPQKLISDAEMSCYIYSLRDGAGYDVLAMDGNGDSYVIYNVRVNSGNEAVVPVTELTRNMKAIAGLLLDTVTIVNDTGEDLYYLFFSPPGSDLWGIELLNRETTLPSGERMVFIIIGARSGFSREVLAFDKNGRQYKKKVTFVTGDVHSPVVVTNRDAAQ